MGKISPILITGCARSGASMIAKAISMCGVFGGSSTTKNGFENTNIVDGIVKPYLRSVGADSDGQFPLPITKDLSIPINWKDRVQEEIEKQGYCGYGPWMLKDSTMCLVWPVWHYAFPDAKWVIVRRRTPDIIHSCLRTAYMTAYLDSTIQQLIGVENAYDGWLWWIHQHEAKFVEMINEGVNCKVVWPERMVSGDYSQFYDALEWLGLSWNSNMISNMTAYIDPLLWHSRTEEKRKEIKNDKSNSSGS